MEKREFEMKALLFRVFFFPRFFVPGCFRLHVDRLYPVAVTVSSAPRADKRVAAKLLVDVLFVRSELVCNIRGHRPRTVARQLPSSRDIATRARSRLISSGEAISFF